MIISVLDNNGLLRPKSLRMNIKLIEYLKKNSNNHLLIKDDLTA